MAGNETEHFTAHFKVTRTRREGPDPLARLNRNEPKEPGPRESVTLAEVSLYADTLPELMVKVRAHVNLVSPSSDA
jgi:hypothetical protein